MFSIAIEYMSNNEMEQFNNFTRWDQYSKLEYIKGKCEKRDLDESLQIPSTTFQWKKQMLKTVTA